MLIRLQIGGPKRLERRRAAAAGGVSDGIAELSTAQAQTAVTLVHWGRVSRGNSSGCHVQETSAMTAISRPRKPRALRAMHFVISTTYMLIPPMEFGRRWSRRCPSGWSRSASTRWWCWNHSPR